MILHLVTDEKFTDYAIKQFSAPEMQSEFVLIPSNNSMGLVKEIAHCKIIYQSSNEYQNLLNYLSEYSGIVLHGLFWPFCADIIRCAPVQTKIAWYFWGGEIYSRTELHNSLLAPITRFLCCMHKLFKEDKTNNYWQLPYELFQRIDYFLSGIPEEFDFVKNYISSSKIKFLWYTCYSIEAILNNLIEKQCYGEGVWLCNSAANANNALDTIVKLSCPKYYKKIKNREITMPLSYGDKWLKNILLKVAPFYFKKFHPLINFLPLEDYNKTMLQCSTIILPYYYPAAQGNIITALWLGMRVYLSEKSMALHFFKRIGAIIFSFEIEFVIYGCDKLTEFEVDQNRKVLREYFSKEHVCSSAKEVVKALS